MAKATSRARAKAKAKASRTGQRSLGDWTITWPHDVEDKFASQGARIFQAEIDAEFIFDLRKKSGHLTHEVKIHSDHMDDGYPDRVDQWLREFIKGDWERLRRTVAFKDKRQATLFKMFWG